MRFLANEGGLCKVVRRGGAFVFSGGRAGWLTWGDAPRVWREDGEGDEVGDITVVMVYLYLIRCSSIFYYVIHQLEGLS